MKTILAAIATLTILTATAAAQTTYSAGVTRPAGVDVSPGTETDRLNNQLVREQIESRRLLNQDLQRIENRARARERVRQHCYDEPTNCRVGGWD